MQSAPTRISWRPYGLAVLATAAATGLSAVLTPFVGMGSLILYFAAVVASAWVGGLGPGIVASLISALALFYFFLPPVYSLEVNPEGLFQLVIFLVVSLGISLLAAARKQAEAERMHLLARAQTARAEAEQAQRRAAFLAEVSSLLTSSLDYEAALQHVARLSLAILADWCIVDVLEPDGSLRRLAVVHADPDKQPFANELQQRYPRLTPQSPHTLWKVVRPEHSWIDPNVSDERLAAEARDAEHLRLLRALGFKAEMVVPLVARGRRLGGITFVRSDPSRPYGPADLALAEELAQRAALAADNARLYAEAQRLNAALEQRVRERTAQLEQKISEHERTLEELRAKERRLAEAQQIAQLGSWHRDLATGSFTWSDELYRIFGLAPQSVPMTFERYLQHLHPDDRALFEQTIHQAAHTHEDFSFDHRIVWPDGQVRVLHGRGTVTLNAAGQAVAMEGTAQDITERHALAAELLSSHEQLRQLSAHLQTAREEERARIAREIHDELGGNLTGLKMDAARLRRLAASGDDAWLAQIDSMSASIDQTVQTVRRIATELRPAILDDFGLLAAVEWQLQEFQSRSGIDCRLQANLEQINLDRDSATALFRVFQETLTNVARHAQATQVRVLLEEQPGQLTLRVQDNGRGINRAELAHPKTFGLVGMRERVRMLAGSLDIRGSAGQGTTVLVRVPLATARLNGYEAATESPA